MLQSLLEEETEREKNVATSQQVAAAQGTVYKVLTRLDSFFQSQAVANTQLYGSFVEVVNDQTAKMDAAATISASAGRCKRPSGPPDIEQQPKRGKAGSLMLPAATL